MAGEDRARLQWVKSLPCLAPKAPAGCSDVTEAHHAGPRGMGQKAQDQTAVPLCRDHHRHWHAGSGPFKGWTQEKRRAWTELVMAVVDARWRARREPPAWF